MLTDHYLGSPPRFASFVPPPRHNQAEPPAPATGPFEVVRRGLRPELEALQGRLMQRCAEGRERPLMQVERGLLQRTARLLLQGEVTGSLEKLQSTCDGPSAQAFAEGFAAAFLQQMEAEEAERWTAEHAAKRLQRVCQDMPGIRVSRVHVCGSYERDTLVAGNFDVDLLVFIRGLTMAQWLKPETGKELKRKLSLGDVEVDLLLVPDLAPGPGLGRRALGLVRGLGTLRWLRPLLEARIATEPPARPSKDIAVAPSQNAPAGSTQRAGPAEPGGGGPQRYLDWVRHWEEYATQQDTGWARYLSDHQLRRRFRIPLKLRDIDILVPRKLQDPAVTNPEWVLAQHRALMRPVYDNPSGASYCRLRERADSTVFTAFVREQPEEVREVARGLKAWRNGLDSSTVPCCGIGSVVLEVLALAAHQQLKNKGDKAEGSEYMTRLFKEALGLLVEAVEKQKVVTVDAGAWGPPPPFGLLRFRYRHCWDSDPVRIIHPIDPNCNVAHQRHDRPTAKWGLMAEQAKHLLDTFRSGTLGEVLGELGPALRLQRERAAAALERLAPVPAPERGQSLVVLGLCLWSACDLSRRAAQRLLRPRQEKASVAAAPAPVPRVPLSPAVGLPVQAVGVPYTIFGVRDDVIQALTARLGPCRGPALAVYMGLRELEQLRGAGGDAEEEVGFARVRG
ncbi:hypothetical protein HYH03_012253 [Edaphochlamys debaryana]|uniref:Uncharacterized protein n=1 Tax=Edaphochlamys debaryana TaxID=47281 RepID=A0A835XVR3_9CHLO|nr:hypothetical protein HYH03_012253 [Edaphochlamys debaryana]|eukprot:KAG2489231.1 hypothetical protein HYH03_012253 [Edaphochlamys debaryana]